MMELQKSQDSVTRLGWAKHCDIALQVDLGQVRSGSCPRRPVTKQLHDSVKAHAGHQHSVA